jgi:hypothetical protein
VSFPFTKQRGEDVLADPLAPDVVAAVAARDGRRVQVHPVGVVATNDLIAAVPNALSFELETPFESIQVDAAGGVEVDCYVCHSISGSCGESHNPSQFVACTWHLLKYKIRPPRSAGVRHGLRLLDGLSRIDVNLAVAFC